MWNFHNFEMFENSQIFRKIVFSIFLKIFPAIWFWCLTSCKNCLMSKCECFMSVSHALGIVFKLNTYSSNCVLVLMMKYFLVSSEIHILEF